MKNMNDLDDMIQTHLGFSLFEKSANDEKTNEPSKNENIELIKEMHSTFELPITYLDDDQIHDLSPIVANDLELILNDSSIYNILFKPQNSFAESLIQNNWAKHFTTNTDFLLDSQNIIREMRTFRKMTVPENSDFSTNIDKHIEIWKSIKKDKYFYDRYSYIEWTFLKEVNRSPVFLQSVSIANMAAPALSFVMPIFCLILPFFILQIQGIPISISMYFSTLRTIAASHFIGKSFLSLTSNMSWNTIIYFIFTIILYIYQIYQNFISCKRFYANLSTINESLSYMKKYTQHNILLCETFLLLHSQKTAYSRFCEHIVYHLNQLKHMNELLTPITEFKPSITKIVEVGYLLRCFYELHDNKDYENTLKWSFGFNAYIDNLYGLLENIDSENVSMATYTDSNTETYDIESGGAINTELNTEIHEQYYPPHLIYESFERNDCILDKNMIVTGPNASGKTTFLKTTNINLILSQQIGCGFYKSAKIHPYRFFHSYLNIPDTSGRDSLFQAESRRCKEILDIIAENPDNKHFCIFDELYSGTNPKEASCSAYSFLVYLAEKSNVDFILTTHYTSICEKLEESDKIINYKMLAEYVDDQHKQIKYLYKIERGISNIEGAITVLENMNYPPEIIEKIRNFE